MKTQRSLGLERKIGGYLTHLDGKPVGSPDREECGPDGLKRGYKWAMISDREGRQYKVQVPVQGKGATRPATPSPAAPPVPPKPPKPTVPDSLELLRRGQELYTVIPETKVDDDAWRAARAMIKACRAALGVQFGPDVLWVAARGDPAWLPPAGGLGQVSGPIDRLGWFNPAQPNNVHVRAGLTPEQTAAIVAHEWGHYAQWKRQGGVGMEVCYRHDPGPYEEEAHEFMYKMMAQFQGDWC